MRLLLEENLAHCTTLAQVQEQTQNTLRELRDEGFSIHYVAGPISCDGEDKISENIHNLLQARTQVMHSLGRKSLALTAPFIFSLEPEHNSYARLGLFDMNREDRERGLQQFWDELIESGLVDGVHFLDGSERSPGATRERHTAERCGVAIYRIAA